MNYRKFWRDFKGRDPGELSAAGKKRDWHPEGSIYDTGVAKGQAHVVDDAIVFRWWDEVYLVPSFVTVRFMERRGDNFFIRMKDLKALEKKGTAIRLP